MQPPKMAAEVSQKRNMPAPATKEVDGFDVNAMVKGEYRETIEEACFAAALVLLEGHYVAKPIMGPLTTVKVTSIIARTLDKSLNAIDVRLSLSTNVSIWIYLTRVFDGALPSLTIRSFGPLSTLNNPDQASSPQESMGLILKNYASLKDDVLILIRLMNIARNMLAEPPTTRVAQDLCAAVQFDHMVYQTVILCVSVTSKGYDGETMDEASRAKLGEMTGLFKKLMVMTLQLAHNFTSKNDRNKMHFWYNVLFEEEAANEERQDERFVEFRPGVAKTEVRHWLERNSALCHDARLLLKAYEKNQSHKAPGKLPPIAPLAWNWTEGVDSRADKPEDTEKIVPHWSEDESDKFAQDRLYGRVSREVDTWWLKARDANYDGWVISMPTVDFAQQRTESCKANLSHRYAHQYRAEDDDDDDDELEDSGQEDEGGSMHVHDGGASLDGEQYRDDEVGESGAIVQDYVDDLMDEEDDDDESYGEGPMTGLLTEIPNILDPKQIEALHLTVKSCIADNAGVGLTRAGENLQKTRCRLFLALDCGKSLLREMLVFIAVWEKDEHSLAFQASTAIVEAIHNSALVPYAWQSLRIPKDIISPAQTVLLRLLDKIFRLRNVKHQAPDSNEGMRDVKLLHFLFMQFRSRIVPECVALMHLQGDCRNGRAHPEEFPIDHWDMERARDGLGQCLGFFNTVAGFPAMRSCLITWEAVYDLLAVLKALEEGVPKKPLVDVPDRSANRPAAAQANGDHNPHGLPPVPPPPPQSPPLAYLHAWTGVKSQLLTILAALLQPPPGKSSPGNPDVQEQILKYNGVVHLLNCCVYDDHNRFARERVQICLKWLLDGSETANETVRNLAKISPPPAHVEPPLHNQKSATTPAEVYSAAYQAGIGSGSGSAKAPSPVPRAVPPPSWLPASLKTSLRIDGAEGERLGEVRNPEAIRQLADFTAQRLLHVNSNQLPPIQLGGTDMTAAALQALQSANYLFQPAQGGPHGSSIESNGTSMGTRVAAAIPAMTHAVAAAAQLETTCPPECHCGTGSAVHRAVSDLMAVDVRSRSEELLRDIISLADEAARFASISGPGGGHETGKDVTDANGENGGAEVDDGEFM